MVETIRLKWESIKWKTEKQWVLMKPKGEKSTKLTVSVPKNKKKPHY